MIQRSKGLDHRKTGLWRQNAFDCPAAAGDRLTSLYDGSLKIYSVKFGAPRAEIALALRDGYARTFRAARSARAVPSLGAAVDQRLRSVSDLVDAVRARRSGRGCCRPVVRGVAGARDQDDVRNLSSTSRRHSPEATAARGLDPSLYDARRRRGILRPRRRVGSVLRGSRVAHVPPRAQKMPHRLRAS